jgi:hypothetical protein
MYISVYLFGVSILPYSPGFSDDDENNNYNNNKYYYKSVIHKYVYIGHVRVYWR